MPRPTQADIAQAVGIDPAQVSRVLRGRSGVAAATRARIQAYCASVGYRLDPGTSSLAERRWAGRRRHGQGIALLIPHAGRQSAWPLGNPRMRTFQTQCAAKAAAAGYRYQTLLQHDFRGSGELQAHLDRHAIGGIIIAFHPDPVDLDLRWQDLSTVLIGDDTHLQGHHRLMTDYQQTVALATARAREAGCRRIGYACLRYGSRSLEDAVIAQMLLQRQRLDEERLPRLDLLRFLPADDPSLCVEWYRRQRPDCIIASHNHPYAWLRAAGVRFPGACSFIGLLGRGRRDEPDLSCVDRRHAALADEAVAMLDQALRQGQRGTSRFPLTRLMPGAWHPGSTLRRAQRSQSTLVTMRG